MISYKIFKTITDDFYGPRTIRGHHSIPQIHGRGFTAEYFFYYFYFFIPPLPVTFFRLEIFPGGKHVLHLMMAEKFNAVVKDFLATTPA